MKIETRDKLFELLLQAAADERNTKGLEYARSKDVLGNFKRISKQLGIEPELVAWVYGIKHLDSVLQYVKRGTLVGGTEPAFTRFAGLINYLLIVYAILWEKDKQAAQEVAATTSESRHLKEVPQQKPSAESKADTPVQDLPPMDFPPIVIKELINLLSGAPENGSLKSTRRPTWDIRVGQVNK